MMFHFNRGEVKQLLMYIVFFIFFFRIR